MSPAALSLLSLALAANMALGQVTGTFPAVPLASKHFSYPSGIVSFIPWRILTKASIYQSIYSHIKSTQTKVLFVVPRLDTTSAIPRPKTRVRCAKLQFSTPWMVCPFLLFLIPQAKLFPKDFCLWAPSEPGKTVGEIEGEMIAWCTKPGHGTRLIPDGTLTGVQFLTTPDYIQAVGFMDQTKIDMADGDFGGEMDPHGADLVRSSIYQRNRMQLIFVSNSVVIPWEASCSPTHSAVLTFKSLNGPSTLLSTLS